MPPDHGESAAARITQPRTERLIRARDNVVEVVRFEQREVAGVRRIAQPFDSDGEEILRPPAIDILVRRELAEIFARDLRLRFIDIESLTAHRSCVIAQNVTVEKMSRVRTRRVRCVLDEAARELLRFRTRTSVDDAQIFVEWLPDGKHDTRSNLAPAVGLEPTTRGLTVRCSTN